VRKRLLRRLIPVMLGVGVLAASVSPSWAAETTPGAAGIGLFDVHRTLGMVALGAFASSLVIGSASGNLGKLMDPARCCPDGGDRSQPWRTIDRTLVTTGIFAYSGAALLATYNLLVRNPPSDANPRVGHQAHRWLALAHGTAFATSAITGFIMSRSQPANSERFATAARIHVASNIVLVSLLTAAFSNIAFE
jgi:hypothetical protein